MEKQFLLVVRNQRGFPVFQLMGVVNNYDTLNDNNVNGSIDSGATLTTLLTEPNGTQFTLTTTVP